ncbi:HAMP domain-containing protein, partial [Modestobacter sp. I12A-02662]|uniref:HAMP domain-containing protein n=1 Tax=Modestobacter sp. I12A-02662 TaxID=1730496 RepID=UPI0034DF01CA
MSTADRPRTRRAWFADRPVGIKVLGAVGITAAAAAAVGLVGLSAVGSTHDQTTALYAHDMAGAADLAAANLAMNQSQLEVVSHASSLDPQFKQRWADQFTTTAADFDAALAAYATHTRSGDLTLVDQARAEYASFADGVQSQAFPRSAAGDTRGYFAARDQYLTPHMTAVQDILGTLTEAEEQAGAASLDEAGQQYVDTRLMLAALLVISVATALAVGALVARSITRGLSKVRTVAEAIEAGDLTVTSGLTSRDEVGRMAVALDRAQESLREVMASVVTSADAVAASSEELSASSAQISASAEETSAQSGVVSAAAEEVSRNVGTVAAG